MTLTNLGLQALLGFGITTGFAILFNTPYQALLTCALIGAAGHLIRFSLQKFGLSNEIATFVGAFVVGVAGYLVVRHTCQPRLLYTVTAVISMVPGIPAYETIMLFTRNDTLGGMQNAIHVFLSAGAIATGLSTARLLMDVLDKETRQTSSAK